MKLGFIAMVLTVGVVACYADTTVQGALVDELLLEDAAQDYMKDAGADDGAPADQEYGWHDEPDNAQEDVEVVGSDRRARRGAGERAEPTVISVVRTPLNPEPVWEVYDLPLSKNYWRDAPILAVPKDGRGVPIILWFGYYHYYGDKYFRQILHSGYVSILDLEVIMQTPRKKLPYKADLPAGTVDPFLVHAVVKRKGRTGMEDDPLVSVPPPVVSLPDDHTGPGPMTPVDVEVQSSPMPVEGRPVFHCGGMGGAPVSGPEECPNHDYDPKIPGPTKLINAIYNWVESGTKELLGNKENCQEACAMSVAVPSGVSIVCKSPALRALPQTATPCLVADVAAVSLGAATYWCAKWCDKAFQ